MSQAQIAPVTAQELAAHVIATQAIMDRGLRALTSEEFVEQCPTIIVVEMGRKYAKIVRETTGSRTKSRSVHHFVDMTTGKIHKAASWKSASKHVRGNIRGDLSKALDTFGCRYLR